MAGLLLILSPGFARVLYDVPPPQQGQKEASKASITVHTFIRTSLFRILFCFIFPVVISLYNVLSVSYHVVRIAYFRIDLENVCFLALTPPPIAAQLSISGSATAVFLVITGLIGASLCGLGKVYFSFLWWWARRNFVLCFWFMMSGVFNFAYLASVDKRPIEGLAYFFSFGIAATPALVGLDLLMLQKDIATRPVPLLLYRLFYVGYLTNNIASYARTMLERAACSRSVVSDATFGEFLLVVASGISSVGALVPLIKLIMKKLFSPSYPAVRYAQRSAVVVNVGEDSGTDRPLLLMVSPGAVTLLQVTKRTELAFGALWQVHVVLSKRYAVHVLVWSVLCALIYLPVSGTNSGILMSELRLDTKRLCFHQRRSSLLSSVMGLATAVVTIGILLGMLVILSVNGLTRAMLLWVRFWLSRSVVFLVIGLLRGMVDFFSDSPISKGFPTLLTYFLLAPLIFALADLLCLLRPTRSTTMVIRLLYLFVLASQISSYTYALSTDNPCAFDDGAKRSAAKFIIYKFLSSVRLVYYYKLIALCLLKIIDTDLPAIDLDPKTRFSTNLPSSFQSIRKNSMGPHQIGLVTEL